MVSSEKVLPPSVDSPSEDSPPVGKKRKVGPPISQEYAREIEYRFWPKVKKGSPDECWPWQSSLTRGYGMIFAWGRPQFAHRIAYAIVRGSVPAGISVLHKCDNPPCCNPDHLFLGTALENMRDRNAKGRANVATGEGAGGAKLTGEQAMAIYNARGYFKDIAREYGVSITTVSKIKMGETWKSITGGRPLPSRKRAA